MIDPHLLLNVRDQEGLAALLSADKGGLGWPVDRDNAFQAEPEIAEGVRGEGMVLVSRLIPASVDEEKLVLLAEFDRPYLRRDLRALLTSLRKHIRTTARFPETSGLGDAIFIVAAPGYEDVRFVLFEERERRLPRIRSFGWRRELIGRTVLTHNLERLCWSDRGRWEQAWDVEGLTDDFYEELLKVFDAIKEAATHPGGPEKKHAYVQQLLNRLLFIAFIERMGWLKTPEGSTDYLHAQWLRYQDRSHYQEVPDKALIPDTFNGLLGLLFFQALDNPEGVHPGDRLSPILGEVPYLNGGLFSVEADLDVIGVTVRDEVFDLVLGDRRPGFEGGLFRRFNFTVTESTPLDQEVAVDPEMLGKIFERIVIAEERSRTGTYYTPRVIVEFMVNEAIKGYLTERGLPAEKAALLVDEDRVESEALSFRPSEMQQTLDWLFEVKAVDPACGSGAYLLMLLQRLFELVDRLEVVRDKQRDPDQKHLYHTKLRLLERCVYGVDISEVAVRIARLRLWLSLVVENRGEKPEPLPSFDFLIMCGDSLASPVAPAQYTLGYPHADVAEYTRLKKHYFHPEPGQQRPTREQMEARRAQVASAFESDYANRPLRSLSKHPFDWEVEFAEVFDGQSSSSVDSGGVKSEADAQPRARGQARRVTSGFDIVVMNPPYVTANRLDHSKRDEFAAYMKAARKEYGFSNDLYVHFMYRALAILSPGGWLAAITPTTFFTNTTKEFLRQELLRRRLSWLIPLDPSVFAATVFTAITLVQKSPGEPDDEFGYLDLRSDSYDQISSRAREQSSGHRVRNKDYRTAYSHIFFKPTDQNRWLFGKLLTARGPIEVNGRKFAPLEVIAPALDTGIDSGNCRSKLFYADASEGRKLPRLIQGTQVVRYGSWWDHPSARFRYVDVEYAADPSISGTGRGGKPSAHGEYWSFRGPIKNHHVSERLLMRQTEDEPFVGYINQGEEHIYTDNTIHTLLLTDYARQQDLSYPYLLAVLNSATAREIYRGIAQEEGRTLAQVKTMLVNRLPIPISSQQDRIKMEQLVNDIQSVLAQGLPSSDQAHANLDSLQAEIDRRVEFLYFHAEEAPTYDEWIAKQEAERGTAAEEIRKLIAAGESGTVEFKQTLEYVDPAGFAQVPESQRGQRIGEIQKNVVHSALKTICAFLNSKGGTLLLGVHDRGQVVGIEPDYTLLGQRKDRDGFEQKLTALLKSRFRPIPTDLEVRFIELDGKTICRIGVEPERTPHYLDNKLYVRLNNTTEELTGRDLEDWLKKRSP